MKIFISADIEGVTGATHRDETDLKKPDSAAFQEQMTAEVAAACEAARKAGATEIWVKDAHASGRNIIPSNLPEDVRLVRGWSGHPLSMVQELDKSFQALLLVGYHARAGSDANPLAHTLSGGVARLMINGGEVSEMMLHTYAAAWLDVPLVFISGDSGVCREASELNPGIVTVAVMEGIGSSTISIHPRLALDRIRTGVTEALGKDPADLLISMPERFSVEINYRRHGDAFEASFYPGAQRKDSLSISFEADDFFEVLRLIQFVI